MENYHFKEARPVWGADPGHEYNQLLGFRANIQLDICRTVKIALSARTYYRIYINGEMFANGPARTAKGYARVDELTYSGIGEVRIAVEVLAMNKPVRYCNDNTMESGMFIME